ncbi:uncharacterized protein [Lepeophtheirus salmonis]|uniref:uncharacterized protein n=1 Tax=Lepeophtheirus salmonis TaxID=72036 RepID=UPI001AE6E7FA|nr:uncharacterized protein LOC121118737 [Lepeophtheirus salmonis]
MRRKGLNNRRRRRQHVNEDKIFRNQEMIKKILKNKPLILLEKLHLPIKVSCNSNTHNNLRLKSGPCWNPFVLLKKLSLDVKVRTVSLNNVNSNHLHADVHRDPIVPNEKYMRIKKQNPLSSTTTTDKSDENDSTPISKDSQILNQNAQNIIYSKHLDMIKYVVSLVNSHCVIHKIREIRKNIANDTLLNPLYVRNLCMGLLLIESCGLYKTILSITLRNWNEAINVGNRALIISVYVPDNLQETKIVLRCKYLIKLIHSFIKIRPVIFPISSNNAPLFPSETNGEIMKDFEKPMVLLRQILLEFDINNYFYFHIELLTPRTLRNFFIQVLDSIKESSPKNNDIVPILLQMTN